MIAADTRTNFLRSSRQRLAHDVRIGDVRSRQAHEICVAAANHLIRFFQRPEPSCHQHRQAKLFLDREWRTAIRNPPVHASRR